MTQTARPASDITTTNWTTAPLFSKVNDASDATTIRNNNGVTTACEVKLASLTDPVSSTGHTVNVRAFATGSSAAEQMEFVLVQGTTVKATRAGATLGRTTPSTATLTLSGAEADSITDYTDLRVRVRMSTGGATEFITVQDIWMDVPDPVVSKSGSDSASGGDATTELDLELAETASGADTAVVDTPGVAVESGWDEWGRFWTSVASEMGLYPAASDTLSETGSELRGLLPSGAEFIATTDDATATDAVADRVFGVTDEETAVDTSSLTIPGVVLEYGWDEWGLFWTSATSETGQYAAASDTLSELGAELRSLAAVADTPIASDAGTASDTSALTAALPAADSGLGSDTRVVAAALPVSDTGVGSDTSAVAISVTDTGVGSDTAPTLGKTVADAAVGADVWVNTAQARVDAGTASDAVTAAGIAVTDSATGADTAPSLGKTVADAAVGADSIVSAALAVADAAVGADVSALLAPVPVTDAASGVDTSSVSMGIVDKVASDAGAGADVVASMTKAVTDAAVGADTSAVVAALPVSDTGVGSDVSILTAVLAGVTDAATAADTSSLAAALTRTDSGAAADVWAGTGIIASETGTGTDTSAIAAALAVTDVAVTSDTSQLQAGDFKTANDSAVGVDAVSGGARAVSDGGTAVDTWVNTGIVRADSATAADTSFLAAALAVTTDTGSGADASALTAALIRTESGVGLDTSSLAAGAQVTASDTGTGSDAITGAAWAVTDLGAGLDTSSLSAGALKSGSDSGIGSDAAATAAVLVATEAGTAVDAVGGTARVLFDTATAADISQLAAGAIKTANDSATGLDVAALTVDLSRTDSAIGSEVAFLAVALGVVDSAVGTETVMTFVVLTTGDTGVGIDSAITTTFLQVAASDFGVGSETAVVFVGLGEIVQLVARFDPTLVLTGHSSTSLVLTARYDPTLSLRGRDVALTLRARFQPEAELVGERA